MSHSSADADEDAGAPPSSPSQSRSMAMARSLFAQLDADGDGWLQRGDLAAFIEDAEKLDEIAAIMDPHNTGRIDVHAFERCFDMFGADEDEEAEAEAAAEAAAAAAAVPPPQVVKAPAPRRHVSFGEADAPARVSVSGTARAGGGGISIPPAGAKKTALKAQNMTLRPSSKKLLLKKGYASLKHALILDELRSSPALGPASPPAVGASPDLTVPAVALEAARVPSPAPSPASASAAPPHQRGHSRQQSSTDYSFQYSKSHSSLMQRANKILAWCADTEGAEAAAASADSSASDPAGLGALGSRPTATISVSELETTIHYLARSFTPGETASLQQLLALHGVPALPVQLFREVIATCIAKEEAEKAALVRDAKAARVASASTSNHAALEDVHLQSRREFDPEGFVSGFLEQLKRKVEMIDVKVAPPAPAHNPNVLASFSTASTGASAGNGGSGGSSSLTSASDASSAAGGETSEGELVLSQLRQSLRLLENESRSLRSKYDFNLVFTKQLESENFLLRSKVDEAALEAARKDDAAAELREALEAHRTFLSGLERSKAALEAELHALREDAQSAQAMLQLERRKSTKLGFDLEKLASQLQQVQHVRSASSRAHFREGLEEMRKNLGSLRYTRRLQAENARVALVESERAEALVANQALQATIAEQQRILNEVQREKIGRMSVSESPARGERASLSQGHAHGLGHGLGLGLGSPVEQQRASISARLLAVPVSPQHNRGSLSEDLCDEEDEGEGSGSVVNGSHQLELQSPAPAASSDDESQAQSQEQYHRELLEQLASVRAQLLAAQSQLQSSRSSRVQVESSFSVAQQSIVQLQEALAEKDAALTSLKDSIPALTAHAEQETVRVREEAAAAARAHATEAAAKSQQAAKAAQELVTRHDAAIAAQRSQHAAVVAALEVTHQEAVVAQKALVRGEADAQLAQQVAFLQKQHASAMAEQDEQQRKAIAALQTQLAEATAAARDATARAAADQAALERAHQSRTDQAQAEFTRTLDGLRSDLDSARAATRAAEESLLAARQAARDHVCAASTSASGESLALQESLSKAQAFSRELEAQMSELRRTHTTSAEKLAGVQKQLEEVRNESARREEQAAQVAADAQAQVAQVQTQLGALQQSTAELSSQHAALQVSLRQSKAAQADLTLQLSSSQTHEQSLRESSELSQKHLSQLVDQWRDECEKRKAAGEVAKRDAARQVEELEARVRALEAERLDLKHAIASHVCVSPGGGVAAAVGRIITSPASSPSTAGGAVSPSSSSAAVGGISVHVQPLSSPLSGSLSALGSGSSNTGIVAPAPAPVPSPAAAAAAPTPVAVVSPFAKAGLSQGHVLEIHAYATFISRALGGDTDLRHLFPLDLVPPSELAVLPAVVHEFKGCGVDLLRKMRDGLLIAKLINVVAPGTIDERVLNKRAEASSSSSAGAAGAGSLGGWQSIVQNLNVCITSAKSLGITMRVPGQQEHPDAFGELDAATGTVHTRDGQRVSIGSESDLASTPGALVAATSPSSTQGQYVGVELGSAQLVLMSCDSSLENLDIVLDFLFQLLRQRAVVHGPLGQVSRLPGLLRLPALPAEARKNMMARTVSLLPGVDAASPSAAAGGAGAGTRKPSPSPRSKATLSKFATLSKAQPANLTGAEHKRFVAHFSATILADFDTTNDLHCLSPEQLLLRWINLALMQQALAAPAGSPAAGSVHFVAHLSDMDVTSYALLLAQVDSWRAHHGLVSTDGADAADAHAAARFDFDSASSASVLAYMAGPLGVAHFHSAASVATRHERLGLLLLALLFHAWPMLDDQGQGQGQGRDRASALSVTVTHAHAPATKVGQVRRLSMGHELAAAAAGGAASGVATGTGAGSGSSSSTASRTSGSSSSSSTSFLPPITEGLSEEESEAQLLRSYLNSCGILGVSINNLFHDVRTGLVLLRLLDWLEAGCVDWRHVERNPTNKFKCISNLNAFLQICREHLHIHFVNIGAVDIYSDSNAKYVLAIVWQLLRFNTIQKLKEIRSRIPVGEEGSAMGGAGSVAAAKEITDASILEWANHKVAARPHPLAAAHRCVHVASFSDSALRNSLFLLNLLDNLQEGCVDWALVEVASAAVDPADVPALLARNASYCISIARKLGAELFALPSDIVNANKKQLVLILASLMACEYGLESAR